MILITGAEGQLASEFKDVLPEKTALYVSKETLDITDIVRVRKVCEDNGIDMIINCAAYTQVDQAESDVSRAEAVNSVGPGVLGRISKELSIFLIHFSTDYIFDGDSTTPYSERDPTNPKSVYGRTKRDGESKMLSSGCSGAILRVSWLYSSHSKNFYTTMKRLFDERDEIRVVYDQVGSPTYAGDLVKVVVENLDKFKIQEGCQTYHFSNEGLCSWFDFAVEICAQVDGKAEIIPILSEEFPTAAPRPKFVVFNKSKIKQILNIKIPHWKDGLRACIKKEKHTGLDL